MDRPAVENGNSPPLRWRRWLRRTGIVGGLVAAVWLFCGYVPAYQYHPQCSLFFFRSGDPVPPTFRRNGLHMDILGPMSEAYLHEITNTINWARYPHLRIGNRLYIPWWYWQGGGDVMINVNIKRLDYLADLERGPLRDTMPDHVRLLITERLSRKRLNGEFAWAANDCDVARALSIKDWGNAR
jgi:hypothetical protein